MYPQLERNILSFLNYKLNFVTPAEVATSYLKLIDFRECGAAATNQASCRKNVASANFCAESSLPILITFYCLSSK